MITLLIKGSLIGGLVAFLWGYISWMALPWYTMTIKKPKNKKDLGDALTSNLEGSGLYVLSDLDETEISYSGPRALLVVDASESKSSILLLLLRSYVIQALAALVATAVLIFGNVDGFMPRILVVGLMGLFSGISAKGSAWNWFYHPTDYTLVGIADSTICWTLVGIVLAILI